jgi:hypothetical protein
MDALLVLVRMGGVGRSGYPVWHPHGLFLRHVVKGASLAIVRSRGATVSESPTASERCEEILQTGHGLLDSSAQRVVQRETAAFKLTVNSEPHPGVLVTVISPP